MWISINNGNAIENNWGSYRGRSLRYKGRIHAAPFQSPQNMDAKTDYNQVIIATLFIRTGEKKSAVKPSSLR